MFPGQYYDRETGLHYNYFRYYDPSTGRYITSDPIGLAGGLNTYLYGNANPNRFIDLQGLNAGLGVGTGIGAGTILFCTRNPSACAAGAVALCKLMGACSVPTDNTDSSSEAANDEPKQCEATDDFCLKNAQRLNAERNFLIDAQDLVGKMNDNASSIALNNDIVKFNREVEAHNRMCPIKVLPLRTLSQQGLDY